MTATHTFRFPDGSFHGTVRLPGDKSLGHRALILAAMAEGESRIAGLSAGADIASTRRVLSDLGVAMDGPVLDSPGIRSWRTPPGPLDCGNSGTTMRLMAGALAGSRVAATLVGDDSLMARPMARLVVPLQALGASLETAAAGTAPVEVAGGPLRGANVAIPIASAQVRTAVALAALSAEGSTTIDSPGGFRDHTENWLEALQLGVWTDETGFRVLSGDVPVLDVSIPGDPSSAGFLWAAAAVRPGSRVVTVEVSLNRGRTGFLEVLQEMGATVEVAAADLLLGDPVGTVSVGGGRLVGVEIAGELTTRSLDELPLVAVVASFAESDTHVRDAAELAVKESNRIVSSVALARLCGADAEVLPDGFIIRPRRHPPGSYVDASGDHRIAIASAIAAIGLDSSVEVAGHDAARVSWPGFAQVLESLWS